MKKGIFIGIIIMLAVFTGLWFSGLLGFRPPGAYDSLVETYKDKFNQNVRTIDQLNTKVSKVETAYLKADSLRTDAENKLVFAKQEIEALGIKLKNARSFTSIETTVKDTFTVVLKDTVFLGEISPVKVAKYSDGYLHQRIVYKPQDDTMRVNYSITDTVMVIDSWIREPNNKGEQVFILWRWLKPWQVKIDVKSKNPKSEVTNGEKLIINEKR